MSVLTPMAYRQRYNEIEEQSAVVRYTKRIETMQRTKKLLRAFIMVAMLGIATLALPLSAHAGANVSIGIGVPVVVAPAPVVVAPPPPAVVYTAPVVVATPPPVVVAPPPVVYGPAPVVVGGYYGYPYRPWKHRHYGWRQW